MFSIESIRRFASVVTVSHSGDGYWTKIESKFNYSHSNDGKALHHMRQLWFDYINDVDLRPKMEDNQQEECRE